jgi:hypothetical protein
MSDDMKKDAVKRAIALAVGQIKANVVKTGVKAGLPSAGTPPFVREGGPIRFG